MQTFWCWWCSKPLVVIKTGKNKGCIAFRILRTAGGNDVYVHDQCLSVAKAAQKVFTAQERR
jgi:hypothetical protein